MTRLEWKTVAQSGKAQAKSKQTFHHEGREEHEVKKFKISIFQFFVSFVLFVVESGFLSYGFGTLDFYWRKISRNSF